MQESGSFERCVVKVENIEDDSTPKILVSNFGNFGVLFLCQFCKNLMKQVLKCEYCKKELDCSMQELDSIAFEEVTLKQNRWLEYVQFMSSELPPSYDLQNETFNPQDLPKFCRVVNRIENEILKHCRTISNLYFNFERNEILSNSDTSIKMQESGSFERCVVKVENIEDDSTPKILIIRVFNDWNKFVSGFDCKKKALTAFIKEYITEDDFQEAIQLLCDDLIFTEELLQKYVCLSTLVKIQCEAQRKLAMEFLSDHKFFEYMKKYEWKANNLENCLKCYVDFDRYKSHDVVKKLKFLNKRFLELSSNVHNIQIKAEDIPPRKNFFKLASMQDLDEALREDVGEALRLQLHFSDEKMASDISGDEGEKSSTEEEESEEFSETEKNLVENQKISNNKDEVSSEMHELNTEEESEEFSETEENLVENQKISNNKDEVSYEMHELNTEEESEEFSETEENLVENQKISNNKDEVSSEMHELNTEEENEDFSETEENLVENQKISNNNDEDSYEMHELNTEEESEDFSETEENLVENQKISNNKDEVSSEMPELNTEEENKDFSETEENLVENQKISNNKNEVSYEMHELNTEEESEEFSETEENLVENQKISNYKDEVSYEMHELNMEEENEEFSETEENLVENQKISNNKDEVSSEMYELNMEENEEFSETEENLVENQKISDNKDEVSYEMHELNTEEESEEFSKTEENLVENQKISNNKDEVSYEMHELNTEEQSEEFSKTEENLVEKQKISNNKDEVSSEMHELNKGEESEEFSKTEENLFENQKISNNEDEVSYEMHELNTEEESKEFSKTEENLVEKQKISNNKDDLSCETHELNKGRESEEFSKLEENLVGNQKSSNNKDDLSCEMHGLNKEEESEEFSKTEENLIESQKISNKNDDVSYEMHELNKEEENEEFSETEENLIENQKFSNNTEDVTHEMPELNDVVEVSAENSEFYDEDEIKDNYDCPIEIKCSSVNFVFLKTFVQAENIIFTISSDGLTFPIQLENGSQTIYCKLTPSLVTAIESDVDEQPNKLVFTVNEEFFNDLKEKGFQSDDFDDSNAKEISFAIEEWPDILTKRLLIVFCQTDSLQDLESESINSDSSSRMSDVSPDINQSDSNDETGADLIFDQLINSDAKLSTDSSSSSSSDASSKMYFFPPSPKDNSKEAEDDFDLPEECISKPLKEEEDDSDMPEESISEEEDFAEQIGDEIQSDWLTEGKNMHRQFDNIISHNDSDENYLIESDEEEDDFDMPEECISKPLKDLAEQIGDEIQSDWLTGGKNMHLQFDNIISDNDRDENYLIESDEEEDDFDMPEESLSEDSLSEESLSEESLSEEEEKEDDSDMSEESVSEEEDFAEQIGDEIHSDWLTKGKNMHLQFDNIVSKNYGDEHYLIESDEEEDDFDMPEESLSEDSLSEESLLEESLSEESSSEEEEEEDDFDLPEECISKLKDFAVQIGNEIQSDWLTEGKNMHLQFDNIISDNDSDEDYSIESDDLDEQRENEMQSDLLTEEENMDLQSKDNESSDDSIASPPQHNLIESNYAQESIFNQTTQPLSQYSATDDNESRSEEKELPANKLELSDTQESIFNQITQPLLQYSVTDDNESRAEEKELPSNKLEVSDTQDSIFNENTQILLRNSVTDDQRIRAEEKELPASKVNLSDTEKSVSDEITQPLLQYSVTSVNENITEEKALPAKKLEFSVTQKHGLETSINSQRKGTSESDEDDSMTLFGSGDLFPGGDSEISFQEDVVSQSPKNCDIQEHSLEMSDSGTNLQEKEIFESFEDNSVTVSDIQEHSLEMSDSCTNLQEKEISESFGDNSVTVSVKEKGVKRKNEGDSDILNFNPDYSKRLCVEVSSLAFDNEVEIRTSDEVESPTCPKQQAKLPSPTKQQANPLSPTKQQTNPLSPTKQQTKPTSSTKQQTKSPSPTEQHAKPMSPTKQSIKLPTIEQQAPPPQSKEQPYNFRSCKTTENKNFASLDPQDHNATEKQPHILRSHKVLENEKSAIDCMSHEPQGKKNHNVTANQPHILRSHKILEKEKSAIHCMSPVPQSQKNHNVTENQPHILRSHKVLEKEKSAIECMPPVPQSKKNDEGKVTEGQSISLPQPARNENEESMSIDSSSNSGSDLVVVFESPRKSRNTSPKKDNDAAIKQPHILRSHKTPENEKPIVESKLTIQSDKGSDLVVGFESPKKDNDAAIKQPHILRSHKTPENEKPIVENKLAIQSDKGSDLEVLYESPRKQSSTQPLKETLSKKVGKQKQSSPEKQSPPWEVVLTKKCQVSLKGFTFKVWLDKQRSFELNDRDLASLSPTRWLRGNIIDFYLQYIIMKSNYQEKTHLFSTDFYSLLSRKEKNDEALVQSVTRSKAAAAAAKPSDRRPWTKNIDIFSQDFIIIPANIENVHWILIIITFLKNVCLEELKSNDASEKPSHILRSRTSSENEKSASVSRASRSDRANDASEKPPHILRSRTSSENEKSASERRSLATRSNRGNDASEKPSHILRSRTSSENEKSASLSRASRSDRANDASEKPPHILRSRTSSENEKSASERRSRATRSDRGNVTSEESSHILRSRSSSESEKSTSVSVTTRSGRANDASEKPPHVLHSCTSSENEKSASERRSRATQSDRGNDTSEESSHILRSRSSSENEKSTSVSVTTRSDRGNRSSSETKSKTKVPKIFVYDSLKSDNKQVVTRIRNFLQEEWEFKKKGIKSFDEKVLPLGPENSAEQLDNHSCGLYVFYFLEKFFKKKMFESNEELTIDEHFRPALKRKEVFEAILKLKKTIAPV